MSLIDYYGKFKPHTELNYDALVNPGPDYLRECQYCLTNAQVQAILALTEPLEFVRNWYSPTEQYIDSDIVDAWRADLEQRLMSCGDVVTTQISESGVWQVSSDGGQTWVDAPGQDPRGAIPFYPPLPGDNGDAKACAGANAIIARYKGIVEEISTALDGVTTEAALTAIFIGFLLLLGLITGGWIYVLLGPTLTLIVAGVSKAAWDAAYSEGFWQQLFCTLLTNIEPDASFTWDDVAAIYDDVKFNYGDGINVQVTLMILRLLWNIGLTNMARSGLDAGMDCDSCGCDLENWTIQKGTLVSRDSTTIVVAAEFFDGTWVAEIKAPFVTSGCNMTIPTNTGPDNMSIEFNSPPESYPGDFPEALTHGAIWGAGQCVNAVLCWGAPGDVIGTVTFTSTGDC